MGQQMAHNCWGETRTADNEDPYVSFRPSGFDRSAESPYCVEFNTHNALSIEQYNDKPFRLHKPLFN